MPAEIKEQGIPTAVKVVACAGIAVALAKLVERAYVSRDPDLLAQEEHRKWLIAQGRMDPPLQRALYKVGDKIYDLAGDALEKLDREDAGPARFVTGLAGEVIGNAILHENTDRLLDAANHALNSSKRIWDAAQSYSSKIKETWDESGPIEL